jgi:hypothetical protein
MLSVISLGDGTERCLGKLGNAARKQKENRGERIRTSDLLVPNQISMISEICRNAWIFDALDRIV